MLELPGDVLRELVRAHRRRWTHADELLALILERLDRLAAVTESAWISPKDRRKIPRGFRYRRPVTPKATPATAADVRAFFSGRHPLRGKKGR